MVKMTIRTRNPAFDFLGEDHIQDPVDLYLVKMVFQHTKKRDDGASLTDDIMTYRVMSSKALNDIGPEHCTIIGADEVLTVGQMFFNPNLGAVSCEYIESGYLPNWIEITPQARKFTNLGDMFNVIIKDGSRLVNPVGRMVHVMHVEPISFHDIVIPGLSNSTIATICNGMQKYGMELSSQQRKFLRQGMVNEFKGIDVPDPYHQSPGLRIIDIIAQPIIDKLDEYVPPQ